MDRTVNFAAPTIEITKRDMCFEVHHFQNANKRLDRLVWLFVAEMIDTAEIDRGALIRLRRVPKVAAGTEPAVSAAAGTSNQSANSI